MEQLWPAGLVLVVAVILLFPDGTLPSHFSRWAMAAFGVLYLELLAALAMERITGPLLVPEGLPGNLCPGITGHPDVPEGLPGLAERITAEQITASRSNRTGAPCATRCPVISHCAAAVTSGRRTGPVVVGLAM